MRTYLTLNFSRASQNQLAHYLQRTGWLQFGQTGAFTEEMFACIQTDDCGLVFLRLAGPDDEIPEPFLLALRHHPAVIITSPYPRHVFGHLNLDPLDFLTEPYSFERFAESMDRYVALFG
ncbi:hypothetical protein [Spirosoma utsteinense]|uniref:Uncharacterized protein n=1 Tax=Spirosoma utsteinense TaxID=2585773 RepID=A0ABR6W460_9BACT|nr:hypothetical protein [Spirosoma utsteinense]MBC3788045.1 hypothetical protein [Spirosoma utsteinense]MBC3791252.1 hypothetical protein [Spirosoma utsteinense]